MTAGVTPVGAPHGKAFYVFVAVFCSVFGFAFAWGASGKASLDGVPLDISTAWRAVAAGIGAIFLIGAMQAFERLLAPARAQARSAAISGAARARLVVLRHVLLGMGTAMGMADFAVHAFWRGHFGFISVLWGVFVFAGYFAADLCGERRIIPYRFR